MDFDPHHEALLEAYRSHYRVCLKSALEQVIMARLNGRSLSLPNITRVFSRHWHACLSDMPQYENETLLRIGHQRAADTLRRWFETPAS